MEGHQSQAMPCSGGKMQQQSGRRSWSQPQVTVTFVFVFHESQKKNRIVINIVYTLKYVHHIIRCLH